MLRNIPNKYMQNALLEEINAAGFAETFDFFYLPMDQHNRANVGYAFINFVFHEDMARFVVMFTDYVFQKHPSQKIGRVSPAHIQGLVENLKHFSNRAVTWSKNSMYRPIVKYQGVQRDLCAVLMELQPTEAVKADVVLNASALEFVPESCDWLTPFNDDAEEFYSMTLEHELAAHAFELELANQAFEHQMIGQAFEQPDVAVSGFHSGFNCEAPEFIPDSIDLALPYCQPEWAFHGELDAPPGLEARPAEEPWDGTAPAEEVVHASFGPAAPPGLAPGCGAKTAPSRRAPSGAGDPTALETSEGSSTRGSSNPSPRGHLEARTPRPATAEASRQR
jgi:hypothetical protein